MQSARRACCSWSGGKDSMLAQAAALGLPLVMRRAARSDDEAVFTDPLRQFAAAGLTHAPFGDIDLQRPCDWEERVCACAGLGAELPLSGQPWRARVDALFALGCGARVMCVDARRLHAGFRGGAFDAAFVADLPASVVACGDNGEFHTFVFAGPRFAWPVAHEVAGVHERRSHVPADGQPFLAELR